MQGSAKITTAIMKEVVLIMRKSTIFRTIGVLGLTILGWGITKWIDHIEMKEFEDNAEEIINDRVDARVNELLEKKEA